MSPKLDSSWLPFLKGGEACFLLPDEQGYIKVVKHDGTFTFYLQDQKNESINDLAI